MPKNFLKLSIPIMAALAVVLAIRWLGGSISENLERAWLDQVLRWRAGEYQAVNSDGTLGIQQRWWAFSKPLDDRIRFVELELDDATAGDFARDGEFAVIADLLDQLAELGSKTIVLDILYSVGRESDQRILFEKIQALESHGTTKIVVPFEILNDGKLARSLPNAGGERLRSGFANIEVDEDRMWRRYHWRRTHAGSVLESLAAATYSTHSTNKLPFEAESFHLNLQSSYFNDAVDSKAGIGRRVWTRQAIEELGRVKPDASPLQDAIVFVGYGPGLDGKPTAHGPVEPGMLLHATALHDAWHGTALHRASDCLDLSLILLVAGLAFVVFRFVGNLIGLTASGMIGLLVLTVLSVLSIYCWKVIPPTVVMLSIWSLAYLGESIRRWTNEKTARIQRDAMLGFYFSPAVLKQVTSNVDMIRPRTANVAVLLSDMRGFTTACEELHPDAIFELLNRLFEVETAAALKEHGSLRPFAGDQFLAYWGAPEPCSDSADRALRSAREIAAALRTRREATEADSLDARLNIGIGLHFGPAVVGHIGSERYRDYNIMGDLINTAARVESQTKNYDAPILATGEFIQALTSSVPAVQLDHVVVKGRHSAVKLFALELDPNEAHRDEIISFVKAFAAYSKGDFDRTAIEFEKLALECKLPTLRKTSQRLGKRCRELMQNPPDEWIGIYELSSK